ncbi:hypothetical protein J0X15_01010 [Roseibium sp. CAU 1637]|uniref:Uncharacterized protein n=1 Tax=Roseibium limicola TaxID=2816037 RepID=A0A939EKA3_9HYPH|nr:hypothetical protein [Roseibium limicola]MBO0343785.1 hypothetical protein [Roseibium limicola]
MALILGVAAIIAGLSLGLESGQAQNTSKARELWGMTSDPRTLLPDPRKQLDANKQRQIDSLKTRQLENQNERLQRQQKIQSDATTCDTHQGASCSPQR